MVRLREFGDGEVVMGLEPTFFELFKTFYQ